MSFRDRILTCVDCREQFIFTAGEQLFFHDRQFKNEPKRCKPCKERRNRLAKDEHGPASGKRVETSLHCQQCGKLTTVPFRPTQGRPVLCRECYWQARQTNPPEVEAAFPQP